MSIREAVKAASFVQAILVLIATALISGVTVPIIVASVQESQAKRERLLSARVALLDSLSAAALRNQFAAYEVYWYAARGDTAKQDSAFARYDRASWQNFQTLWSELVRGRRLLNDSTYRALERFIGVWMGTLDRQVEHLQVTSADSLAWEEFGHCQWAVISQETPAILFAVAEELDLQPHAEPRSNRRRNGADSSTVAVCEMLEPWWRLTGRP